MSAVEATVGIDTAVKGGLALYEERKRLNNALRGFRRRLKQGKVVIVIVGLGGVGKTTLGSTLSEDFDPMSPPTEYTESQEPETFWLKSNPMQSIVVVPGQEFRSQQHRPVLLEKLTRAKRPVLINVVSYGYHSLNEAATLKKQDGAVEVYLKERRSRELKEIEELATFLKQTPNALKMITLVTKEDLWWNQRDEVRGHYESGEYNIFINSIRTSKGSQHFIHEFAYVSLCHFNLKTIDGMVIGLTTEGYDDKESLKGQRAVFDLISKFSK